MSIRCRTRVRSAAWGVGVCVAVLAEAAWAATATTLTATADAKVHQSSPTKNYAASTLQTSAAAGAAIESYLRFDVAGIGGTVTSARLRLYSTAAVADGPAVYTTGNSWTETGLTWNNRPTATSGALADVAQVGMNTWVEWNVTAAVTGNGTVSFLLRNQAASTAAFRSRETTSVAPRLVVTWAGPCEGKANGTACSDGNACTTGDTCQAGACLGGPALICSDANPCTTDSCSATIGCVATAAAGSCDLDGNACTADSCSGGSCVAGGALVCNDGNPCTDDSCNSQTGCVAIANSAPCTKDTNPCTVDVCSGGACTVGPAPNCDDANPCTVDGCNSATGACTHATDPSCGGAALIPFGSIWKVLVTGSAPPAGWASAGFNDSGWATGQAELGYGQGDERTVIGYGGKANQKYITTYFRRAFSVANPSVLNHVTLTIERNDGAVVYLNGSEIYRTNMALGAFTYTTKAVVAATGDEIRSYNIPTNLLVAGTNVLAVEVHQVSASSADLSFDLELARKCPVPIGDAAYEAFETVCDGKDNDCDGNTDVLLPQGANLCATGQAGACGKGSFACLDGAKVCLTGPAVAESKNGSDDDCDGATDEATSVATKKLGVRVLMPHAMWSDSPTYAQGVVEMIEMAGAPYTALTSTSPGVATDWYTGFDNLADYAVVLIPGYVEDATLAAWQMQKLTDYMNQGGIVVLWKPLGAAVGAFAGHTGFTHTTGARTVRVEPNVPAALWLDALEERDFLLSKDPSFSPVSLYTFSIDAAAGATVWGTAKDGATSLGAVFSRKPVGSGALYALGYDPLSYTWMRCYVNCFDPGRDILVAMIKGWLREAGQGHAAFKHVAPSAGDAIVVVSHDIDAPDSHNAGSEYGEAGAIQMAKAEKARGVKGSYMITTDYVAAYNNANLPADLCALGMCPIGGHSVQHLIGANLPVGDCSVTKATYVTSAPTLCGETVVNLDILKGETPGNPDCKSWRCPYLSVHPNQFEVLAGRGVIYDTSYAVGDVRTNFPLKADRWPYMDHVFNHQPLWEFPIELEDGRGDVTNGVTSRVELQQPNQRWFLNNWLYAYLKNAANGAWSMNLVHPSYGVGVGPENTVWKVDTVAKFIDLVKPLGAHIDTLDAVADWWRARDEVDLIVNWNQATGYVGSFTVGSLPISGFAIEFTDAIGTVNAPGAGAVTVSGRRVIFTSTLAAGSVVSFQASVAP